MVGPAAGRALNAMTARPNPVTPERELLGFGHTIASWFAAC